MTEMDDRTAQQGDSNVFDLTRRGYDRRQVDDHVHSLLVQLAETEQARQREVARANRAEAELGHAQERLRAQIAFGDTTQRLTVVPPVQDVEPEEPAAESADALDAATWSHAGFGQRLEKLLRAAEQEAALTRQSANREAHALIEQARADAEVHRHELEQTLVARTTEIDQKAARRKVELDERERGISEQSAAAQEESEQLVAEAQRLSEDIQARAHEEVEQLVNRAEEEIAEREAASQAELTRLERMRDGVRGDLGRMMQSLAGEFDQRGDGGERASRPSRVAGGPQRPARAEATSGTRRPAETTADEMASLQDSPSDEPSSRSGFSWPGEVRGHDAPARGGAEQNGPAHDGPVHHASALAGPAREVNPGDDRHPARREDTAHGEEPVSDEPDLDGEYGTLAIGHVEQQDWFGRSRAGADGTTRPPPGPGHLRRTGHGGHGRSEHDTARSRWFERSAGHPTDHVPADHVPADHVPADHVPADHVPADHGTTELGAKEHRVGLFDAGSFERSDAGRSDAGSFAEDVSEAEDDDEPGTGAHSWGRDDVNGNDRDGQDAAERAGESHHVDGGWSNGGPRYRTSGPAGLPGPVSPVGSMSLAGPIERFSLSAPIGRMGPVGPFPGH